MRYLVKGNCIQCDKIIFQRLIPKDELKLELNKEHICSYCETTIELDIKGKVE